MQSAIPYREEGDGAGGEALDRVGIYEPDGAVGGSSMADVDQEPSVLDWMLSDGVVDTELIGKLRYS